MMGASDPPPRVPLLERIYFCYDSLSDKRSLYFPLVVYVSDFCTLYGAGCLLNPRFLAAL